MKKQKGSSSPNFKNILILCCVLSVSTTKITTATPTGFDWDKNFVTISAPKPAKTNSQKRKKLPSGKKTKTNIAPLVLQPKAQTPAAQVQVITDEQPDLEKDLEREIDYYNTICDVEEDESVEEKFECPLCIETRSCNEKKIFPCCGYEICKHCLENLMDLEEQQDDLGTTHPKAIKYADELATREDIDSIMRYHSATPESEPEWKWYKINRQNYFLQDKTLWRYAREESKEGDGYLYSWHWRFIIPPRCPECYKICTSCLDQYRI